MKNKILVLLSLIVLPFITQGCAGDEAAIFAEATAAPAPVTTTEEVTNEVQEANAAPVNTNSQTPPANTPSAAQVAFSIQGINLALNYAYLDFSLKNVQSAFLISPLNSSLVNPVLGNQFKGNILTPFPGNSVDKITKLLNVDPLYHLTAQGYDSATQTMLPLNYCLIPAFAKWNSVSANSRCFESPFNYVRAAGYNAFGYNYVNLFIPIREGQARGTWKVQAPNNQNVFSIFYRDWAGRNYVKTVRN